MADNTYNWLPPDTPGTPAPASGSQASGFDFWGWLTSGFHPDPNRPHRPDYSQAEYDAYMKNDPVLAWIRSWDLSAPPEYQLARLIAQKEGIDMGATRSLRDAYLQRVAMTAAHRAMVDPAYRQQLAQSMGWNMNNPHVQYWVQHGGKDIPSDPMGTGTAPGQASTTTGAAPKAQAVGATAAPFDPSKWGGRAGDPGFTYGAMLPPEIAARAGVDRQWGVDYALPEGTALNSPFAGTVIESDFNGPYGNTVVVRMANGVTYRVAHLEAPGLAKGSTVSVGEQLGLVGNTGNSYGAHVLIEMRDPQGKPIDPTPIIDELLKGGADLSATGSAYQKITDLNNMVAGQAGPFLTPDGHWIYPGSQDYNVYAAAQSLWKARYGGDPPWTFVSGLMASGATTKEQIQAQMDAMPSDISGMDWGSRDTFNASAQSAAGKLWNRSVPVSTLQQLAKLGLTSPQQVQDWFGSHPAAALDAQTYGQYFDAANTHTQATWQQPPSPDLIAEIHKQMQQGPTGG